MTREGALVAWISRDPTSDRDVETCALEDSIAGLWGAISPLWVKACSV